MGITQTQLQSKNVVETTRLEYLCEWNKRVNFERAEKLQEEFRNLEKGVRGEGEFEKLLFENGQSHWVVLKNVWLDTGGVFECDYLVFTHAQGYLFEIKNYAGSYAYKESQWFRWGKPISHNPLSQVQKAKTNLQRIFPTIKGVLVFIGEFNPVHVHDEVKSIQIVERSGLMELFWTMKQEEQSYLGYGMDKEAVLNKLAPYETNNPYNDLALPKEIKESFKPGICCSYCANFDLDKKEGFYICACGVYEPREHAILRTICEYGMLFPDQHFKTSSLLNFFEGEIKRTTLIKVLNTYFRRVGKNRNTIYINNKIRPYKVKEAFKLEGDVFLMMK